MTRNGEVGLVKANLQLPADLIRDLKVYAATHDLLMRDVVAEALRAHLHRDGRAGTRRSTGAAPRRAAAAGA